MAQTIKRLSRELGLSETELWETYTLFLSQKSK